MNSDGDYPSGGSSSRQDKAKIGKDASQSSRRRRRKQRAGLSRSLSDSSVPAKLSAWRKEVLRVEQEFRLGPPRTQADSSPRGVSRRKRHRSADSVCAAATSSSSFHLGRLLSESDGKSSSRSSSPAPSSGVECNSIKVWTN